MFKTNIFGLEYLKEKAKFCTRCPLHKSRTNSVFDRGNPEAQIMILGESPGFNEDIEGKPFVGKAGKLLDEILKEINISQDKTYITNIVKCRPPDNRQPEEIEITTCYNHFLSQQIKIIQPKIIITLGNIATQIFLGKEKKITEIRGNIFQFKDFLIIPTFHPAYILRNPHKRNIILNDFKKIKLTYETYL